MAIDMFKGMFKEISVLEILNLFQMSSMKGLMEKIGIGGKRSVSNDPSGDASTTANEGGKGNIDEHNALIAMAEAHFAGSGAPAKLTITRSCFRKLMAIFKLLREQGKSGGAEKLMHIIGHESHLQGTAVSQRASGPKGQKPEGEPPVSKIDIHNVRERTNPAGQLIIRFLTDIEPQEAVDLLTAASITDNGKDKTAAAAKAAKEKLDEGWQAIAKWWYDGNRDLRIHSAWARIVLADDKAMERILSSDRALELWNSFQLESNDPVRARRYIEQLEGYIWEQVNAHQDASTEEPNQAPTPSPSRFQWLPRKMPWMFIVWGTAGFFVLLTILTQHLKSLGN